MEPRKVCFKCNAELPLSNFYKHAQMRDGHLNKCKLCTKKDTEQRRTLLEATDPKWVASERERHRVKARKNQKLCCPEAKAVYAKKHKALYPEKNSAKNHSQRIPRTKDHNHHWSYKEEHWKDIIAVTTKEHAILHRFMTYDQERMQYRIAGNNILLDTKQSHLDLLCTLMDKHEKGIIPF